MDRLSINKRLNLPHTVAGDPATPIDTLTDAMWRLRNNYCLWQMHARQLIAYRAPFPPYDPQRRPRAPKREGDPITPPPPKMYTLAVYLAPGRVRRRVPIPHAEMELIAWQICEYMRLGPDALGDKDYDYGTET